MTRQLASKIHSRQKSYSRLAFSSNGNRDSQYVLPPHSNPGVREGTGEDILIMRWHKKKKKKKSKTEVVLRWRFPPSKVKSSFLAPWNRRMLSPSQQPATKSFLQLPPGGSGGLVVLLQSLKGTEILHSP